MEPNDRVRLPLRWQFVPMSDPRDNAIRWTWRAYTQTGASAMECAGSFDSLTECMDDAKANGYGQP
jgi:hypothetical protein